MKTKLGLILLISMLIAFPVSSHGMAKQNKAQACAGTASIEAKMSPGFLRIYKNIQASANPPTGPVTMAFWLKAVPGLAHKVFADFWGEMGQAQDFATQDLHAGLMKHYPWTMKNQEQYNLAMVPTPQGLLVRVTGEMKDLLDLAAKPEVLVVTTAHPEMGLEKSGELGIIAPLVGGIFTGDKTVTIRRGRREIPEGKSAYMVVERYLRFAVLIKKVTYKKFMDLTKTELQGEGKGVTYTEMLEAMQHHYPGFQEDEIVSVVHFEIMP